MDYNELMKEALQDGLSEDSAEEELAEVLHEHVNELVKSAANLYEDALELRCNAEGRVYANNRPIPEKFPMYLFTSNISTNKLDEDRWSATLENYILQHIPKSTDAPAPQGDPIAQIMHHLRQADFTIRDSLPYQKDLPDDMMFSVQPMATRNLIGAAVASASKHVFKGLKMYHLLRYRGKSKAGPKPPKDEPSKQAEPLNLRPLSNPSQSIPPIDITIPPDNTGRPQAVHHPPQTNQRDYQRKAKRDAKRDNKLNRDKNRKDRSDFFFGYVDRVDKLDYGYEIRVEAIAENSLTDEVFIRAVEKIAVGSGTPSFGRHRLALVWIYTHGLPPGVSEGIWVNFRINQENKKLVTEDYPDLRNPYPDGLTILEPLEPRISFQMSRFESYFANNSGYVVQTDVKTITKDIATTFLTTLQHVFGQFNIIGEALREVIGQTMDSNYVSEATSHPEQSSSPARSAAASLALFSKVPAFNSIVKNTVEQLLLPRQNDVLKYSVYNIGQGHSACAFDEEGAVFVNDFGYGQVGNREETVCLHMIYGQSEVPILLSHWDTDHYRIAKSTWASKFSGTCYDVTNRPWIAPGKDHIKGTIANELAWGIQQNEQLYQWTENLNTVSTRNVTIKRCQHNVQFSLPDKNNLGALAVCIGRGNNLMLYPGDANYESIPGSASWSGRLRSLIATHHGSMRSLEVAGQKTGSSIPHASSGEAYAVFSYANGNKYGHDLKKTMPFYEKKGFTIGDGTALLKETDTIEILHFDPHWDGADSMLWASPSTDTGETEPIEPADLDLNTSRGPPGSIFRLSALPLPPAGWANDVSKLPCAKLHDKYQGAFKTLLTLRGSGDSGGTMDHDDLEEYAIRDEDGDVVLYDITATDITMVNLPLHVPCKTDYPVTVQISCQDIELVSNIEQGSALPLVRFNVASGAPWPNAADPATDGLPGDAGYAGGRLRLAVTGNWHTVTYGKTDPIAGLSVQYRGGHGGDGQRGGDIPLPGRITFNLGDPPPTYDYSFGNGGDAGDPGTIADSEILAVGSKWPTGWTTTIDRGIPGTDSEFGKPGRPGRKGLPIPSLSKPVTNHYWLLGSGAPVTIGENAFMVRTGDENTFVLSSGNEDLGSEGKEFDTSKLQYSKRQVKLTIVPTEDEMLSLMAPVDWRYLS